MFAKARDKFEAEKPLAKQLFPSSSPSSSNGDIRKQLQKPNATSSAAASTSARTSQTYPDPLSDRSANMAAAASAAASNRSKPSLYSLYGNKDSFKQETSVVDLTGPDAQSKAKEAVYFAEDDFSDDENLDLDYQAPSALPILPASKPLKQNMPPPPSLTPNEAEVPWSSSPASHFWAPAPKRSVSGTSTATEGSLKRESSGENYTLQEPPQKKATRRVLPPTFRREQQEEENDHHHVAVKIPPKPKNFWDPTASAIKEQKRQLKNQRQPKKADVQDMTADEMLEAAASHNATKAQAVNLSTEQEHVLDLVVNKDQSVFFTGPAGTGKSVLMRAIIKKLKAKHAKNPERVAVTASTGLAACNIGGMTLHSFSGIGLGKEDAPELIKKIRRNNKAKERWLKTKYLIIDEVSMVDGDLFDKLSQIGRTIRNNGRPWGGIKLIITGDFFQLPPVPDFGEGQKRDVKFAFDAATWDTSIDHTIGLNQVFRQRDPDFARMLNEMRLGRISDDTDRAFKALSRPLKFDDGVDSAELFPTRRQVEVSNQKRLEALPGTAQRYEAADTGDPKIRDRLLANMMSPKSIDLKINAQVMLIKNLDETLVNGSLGKVVAFSDEKTFDMKGADEFGDEMEGSMAKAKQKLKAFSREPDMSDPHKYPVVEFRSIHGVPRTILCVPEEWKIELPNGEVQAKRSQLPLILAWALSIHKAQGQTLERVTVNLGQVFEKGQAYVALSRATCQAGLRVQGFSKAKVMAHPRVVGFYDKLYSAEDALKRKPASITDFLGNKKGPAPQSKKVINTIDLDDEEEAMAAFGY